MFENVSKMQSSWLLLINESQTLKKVVMKNFLRAFSRKMTNKCVFAVLNEFFIDQKDFMK